MGVIKLIFINLSDVANEKNQGSKNTSKDSQKINDAKKELQEQREKAQARKHEKGKSM